MVLQYIASSSGGNIVCLKVIKLHFCLILETDQLKSNYPFPRKANSSGLIFMFF